MRRKDRLTPYPILDNQGDDYIESSFRVDYDVRTQFTQVKGKLKFNLENDDIKYLIDKGLAEFIVHIECPSTSFREVESTFGDEVEFIIDETKLAKNIEIRTFVILKEAINSFSSSKFHPDYKGQKFDLMPHQIIAIGTSMDFSIEKDDRDFEELPSVIQIKKLSDNRKGTMTVNTDSDEKILIGLYGEVYELYARLGKTTYLNTSFALVLIPAMIIILQRMCNGREDDDMISRHWFKVINSKLEANGLKLENISSDNDTLLKVCQEFFSDPLNRSFNELNQCCERMR